MMIVLVDPVFFLDVFLFVDTFFAAFRFLVTQPFLDAADLFLDSAVLDVEVFLFGAIFFFIVIITEKN